MDHKMHAYSVLLRSLFAFPCVRWNFEVEERLWPEIRGGETAFPRVLLHINHCASVCRRRRLSSSVICDVMYCG